ncbi:hypothetical protein FHY71_07125 [Bacillus tropicus]|uniref:Uncharacterized protein n=1 Tax=Bacillus tropicus TaxID=2026188 RepID=A0A5C5AAA4_9BACI|nr:hypothetical protein FHY71_07125 [Bacillus tropicus]
MNVQLYLIMVHTVKCFVFQSTIENRTYIWYNRNILYETMYMSLTFTYLGTYYITITTLYNSVYVIQINR